MKDYYSKYTITKTIERLIQQERRNSAQYIALNPADADRRRMNETLIIGAFTQVLNTLTE